jgi:lipopolysaccharide export system permease protein
VVFRYLLKEVVPQFFSTFIVFCSVIMVSQLVRLSEIFIAFGLTVENILLPFLYIILPFLTIIIPLSLVFSVMMAFSRLSADGEYAALLATGYSLRRASVPVIVVAFALYLVGTTSAMYLEAWGRREFVKFQYRKTQSELDSLIKFKMHEGVFLSDFIGYIIYAEKISKDRSQLTNVLVAPGAGARDSDFFMLAPRAEITGSVEKGEMRMVFHDGNTFSANPLLKTSTLAKFGTADIDLLRVFQQQIFGDDFAKDDYRSYPPTELIAFVKNLRKTNARDPLYWKASYLLYSRVSNPFSVFAFALFGMVLGIQDARRGKGSAFIFTIIAVMLSYVLTMAFKWFGENGHISAISASWVPQLLLFAAAAFLVYQRNRLPPGEGMVAWQNLPFVERRLRHK